MGGGRAGKAGRRLWQHRLGTNISGPTPSPGPCCRCWFPGRGPQAWHSGCLLSEPWAVPADAHQPQGPLPFPPGSHLNTEEVAAPGEWKPCTPHHPPLPPPKHCWGVRAPWALLPRHSGSNHTCARRTTDQATQGSQVTPGHCCVLAGPFQGGGMALQQALAWCIHWTPALITGGAQRPWTLARLSQEWPAGPTLTEHYGRPGVHQNRRAFEDVQCHLGCCRAGVHAPPTSSQPRVSLSAHKSGRPDRWVMSDGWPDTVSAPFPGRA